MLWSVDDDFVVDFAAVICDLLIFFHVDVVVRNCNNCTDLIRNRGKKPLGFGSRSIFRKSKFANAGRFRIWAENPKNPQNQTTFTPMNDNSKMYDSQNK